MSEKNEIVGEGYKEREILRSIDYRDFSYSETNEELNDIRQRLKLLKKFPKNELRIKYWNKLLLVSKDSPACFIEMLNLVTEEDYKFHNTDENNKQETKWIFEKFQTNKKHRIEMLPSNIQLKELAENLNNLFIKDVKVLMNLGGNSHFINTFLLSIENLAWLNLSNCNINNMHVKNIFQSISRGKLKKLKGIILTNNCKIRMDQLHDDLKLINKGDLQYLEIDKEYDPETTSTLKRLIVPEDFKIKTDAQKLVYLLKHGIIGKENDISANKDVTEEDVIIDYGICDGNWYERVQLGLEASLRSISYKVTLNKKLADSIKNSLSDKVFIHSNSNNIPRIKARVKSNHKIGKPYRKL